VQSETEERAAGGVVRSDPNPTGFRVTQHSNLRDYLTTLRRRKWLIAQAVVLLPAVAIALSLHQQKLFRAHAEVLLSHQNLANQLTGTSDPTQFQQPDRVAQTQADLARVPEVARRTLAAAGLSGRTPDAFLEQSRVTATTNTDLLDFAVTDPSASVAATLVNAYAKEFAAYRGELDTAALRRARNEVRHRIATLAKAGARKSELYATLVSKEQTLGTMEALQTSNAVPVRSADGAAQVQPRTVRNAILGLVLGVVLGLGLAFLWEALDTRVRTADEIGESLGLPLLARLPEPPRRFRKDDKLVMVDDAHDGQAEAFRMLRTSLDFVRLDQRIRTIVITSAVEKEGKSTTAANLAVALARAGQRVALVDVDLRRPYLDRFFNQANGGGLTEVALGRKALSDALSPITLALEQAGNSVNGNGRRSVSTVGDLQVLVAGPLPPNAGEFVGSAPVVEILDELRERFDTVLIDAPPLLHVGDALTLGARADAFILVTRLNLVRRPMLAELRRILESTPAKGLGFVITGAEAEDGYRYGARYDYGYGSSVRERPREAVQ
jgi:polysaccharide biosynthesis transport protein